MDQPNLHKKLDAKIDQRSICRINVPNLKYIYKYKINYKQKGKMGLVGHIPPTQPD